MIVLDVRFRYSVQLYDHFMEGDRISHRLLKMLYQYLRPSGSHVLL